MTALYPEEKYLVQNVHIRQIGSWRDFIFSGQSTLLSSKHQNLELEISQARDSFKFGVDLILEYSAIGEL